MSGCTRLLTRWASTACCLARSDASIAARWLPRQRSSRSRVVAIAIVVVAGRARRRRGEVPRERVLVRRAACIHAAQLAVIRLRVLEPDLPRPFRARPEVRDGVASLLPLPALIGAPLDIRRLGPRDGHASGGALRRPRLARGRCRRVLFVTLVRESTGCSRTSSRITALPPGAEFARDARADEARRHRRGDGGDCGRAGEGGGATVQAIFVVRVPREFPLEARCRATSPSAADASLEEARALGEDNGVDVRDRDGRRSLDRTCDRRRGGTTGART